MQALSAGEHYFTCSVGDHCQRGMRLTVRVEPELQPNLLEDTRVRTLSYSIILFGTQFDTKGLPMYHCLHITVTVVGNNSLSVMTKS